MALISLFAESEYLLELYRTHHPEDMQTTADDLDLVTLETVIAIDIQNDLGLAVGNRLIILAEAQSTWSVNIIVRCFFYIARSCQSNGEMRSIFSIAGATCR